MNIIIEQLENNNIPFNKKKIKDNIIFVPNAIIKIKNFQTIKSNMDIEHFIKQIYGLYNQYNKHIYILILDIDNTYKFEHFTHMFYYNINSMMASICESPELINISEYFYGIRNQGALWTLVSQFEYYYQIFRNKLIYTDINTYQRAIIIMNDNELELLNRYNINILPEMIENENICYITQNTFKERDMFNYVIKYMPLVGIRVPCRLIENITTICPQCSCIAFINNNTIKKHGKCVM